MADSVVVHMQNMSVPHANQDPDLTACQQTAHVITSKDSGAHLLIEQQPAYLSTGMSTRARDAIIQHQSGMINMDLVSCSYLFSSDFWQIMSATHQPSVSTRLTCGS